MDFQTLVGTKSRILLISFCIIQRFPFPAHIQASPQQRHIPSASEIKEQLTGVYEFGSRFARSIKTYYNPTTCIIRSEYPEVCQGGEEKNKSMCKKLNCCPAVEDVPCYNPFLDKAQWALRMFLTGFISLLFLALIPILCCGAFQKSECCAPANRDAKKILEIKKKQEEKREKAEAEKTQVQEETIVKKEAEAQPLPEKETKK